MVVSSWLLGDAFHRQGRFGEARDVLQRGADISLVTTGRSGARRSRRGSVDRRLAGRPRRRRFDAALATARSIGNRFGEAGILGKRAEIGGDPRRHRRRAQGHRGDRSPSPRISGFGRTWLAGSGPGPRRCAPPGANEAEAPYRRALALFEELGLEAEASAVRTELALGDVKIAFD